MIEGQKPLHTDRQTPTQESRSRRAPATDKSISSRRRGRSGPKLSPQAIAMREELSRLLASRQPVDVNALAERHGVSSNSIYKTMRTMGKPTTLRLDEQTRKQIEAELPQLWQNLSIPALEIAEKYGVSLTTINRLRKNLGLPKRERPKRRFQAPRKRTIT